MSSRSASSTTARPQRPRAAPATILSECRKRAVEYLQDRLEVLGDRIDDNLFELADKAGSSLEQSSYFDAMRELRLKRGELSQRFGAGVDHALEPLIKARRGRERPSRRDDSEPTLDLIGHDELERELASDGVIDKARRLYDDALYFLGRRLQALSAGIDPDDHPLDPRMMVESFGEALGTVELELKIQLILFKLFDKHVASELGPLYDELNHFLIAQGVLPNLTREAPRVTLSQSAVRPSAAAPGMEDTLPQGGAPPSPVTVAGGGEMDLMTLLQRLLPQSGDTYATVGAVSGSSPGGGVAGIGAIGVAGGSTATGGAGGYVVASDAAVVSALTGLQRQSPTASGQRLVATNLKSEILQSLDGSAEAPAAMGPMQEGVIDLVLMVFDIVLDDDALPSPVKAAISRLQIPVLKAAILDRGFFSNKRHPARSLLNELAQAGLTCDAGDPGDELLARIESLVQTVLDEFEDDPDVFGRVHEELLDYLEEQDRRAEYTEEQSARTAQNEESLKISEVVATETVRQILRDSEIPEPIADFLRTTWRGLLVLVYYRHGGDSELWTRVLNVASMLVWSLTPKSDPAERAQLVQMLPALQRALREGMRRMSLSDQEQDAFMQRLAAAHAKRVRPGRSESAVWSAAETPATAELIELRTPGFEPTDSELMEPGLATEPGEAAPVPEPAGTVTVLHPPRMEDGRSFMARKVNEIQDMLAEGRFVPEVQANGEVAEGEEPPKAYEYDRVAETMREGTWIELPGEDGKRLRAKLSWKSLISGKYFFVNRQGFKVREMTADELAAGLRSGEVQTVDETPILDKALDRLMSKAAAVA